MGTAWATCCWSHGSTFLLLGTAHTCRWSRTAAPGRPALWAAGWGGLGHGTFPRRTLSVIWEPGRARLRGRHRRAVLLLGALVREKDAQPHSVGLSGALQEHGEGLPLPAGRRCGRGGRTEVEREPEEGARAAEDLEPGEDGTDLCGGAQPKLRRRGGQEPGSEGACKGLRVRLWAAGAH